MTRYQSQPVRTYGSRERVRTAITVTIRRPKSATAAASA